MTSNRAQADFGFILSAPASARARGETTLTLYMFHCRRVDGSPICLDAQELTSDRTALISRST
jgi:hypothetical protein